MNLFLCVKAILPKVVTALFFVARIDERRTLAALTLLSGIWGKKRQRLEKILFGRKSVVKTYRRCDTFKSS